MPKLAPLAGLAFAAALAGPIAAQAAANLTLTFTGVALQGSGGSVSPYGGGGGSTSFAGEPVTISMTIAGQPGALYVSGFSATWSGQTYALPYQTSAGATGFPNDGFYDNSFGVMSNVSLTSAGGSISIFPTNAYISTTDGELNLGVNFNYGSPHGLASGVTGGGAIVTAVNQNYRPDIGFYDGGSSVSFNLTGMTREGAIPEPSAWALMLIGVAGIGGAIRLRRRPRRGYLPLR